MRSALATRDSDVVALALALGLTTLLVLAVLITRPLPTADGGRLEALPGVRALAAPAVTQP